MSPLFSSQALGKWIFLDPHIFHENSPSASRKAGLNVEEHKELIQK